MLEAGIKLKNDMYTVNLSVKERFYKEKKHVNYRQTIYLV